VDDSARYVLQQLVGQYGIGVYQVPRSCELFIRQACGPYPRESRVLIEALHEGVPGELSQFSPDHHSWIAVADSLSDRLRRRGLADDEARWAVETWAKALSRHPDHFQTPPHQTTSSQSLAFPEGKDPSARGLVLLLSAGGGAVGGFLGSVCIPASVLLTSVAAKVPHLHSTMRACGVKDIGAGVTLVLLLFGIVGAFGGTLGAALGIWFSKAERPSWATALAPFGAAFFPTLLGTYFLSFTGACLASGLGAFGASRWAGRGGR
jgi:hypothetical protein